jgi:myo-inositol-1(or 4)-monophosphatase
MIKGFAIRRPGSAVLDLCHLAAGHFDGFWEFKLHAWDVAAGSLIVTEAGGQVTGIGSAIQHFSKDILVSNKLIHQQMIEVVK